MKSNKPFLALFAIFSILLNACGGAAISTPTPTTPEPISTAPVTTGAAAEITTRLSGLEFDDFLEASWRDVILRSPETIIELGLTSFYGQQFTLNNLSDEFLHEQYAIYAAILSLLKTYNRDELSANQQISYDIYAWYLQDKLDEQPFMYYDYPVTFFSITSLPDQIVYFFTDLLPLATSQDAQTYLLLLKQVDTKMGQILQNVKLREQAGIIPPKFAIQWAVYGNLGNLATGQAADSPFYTNLQTKLEQIGGLSDPEKQSLLDQAKQIIENEILPAYQEMRDYLDQLSQSASTTDGVWQFPQGKEYYAYLLRHYTTTDLSAKEIHQLGLQELERIHAEMRAAAKELGYPEGESIPDLYDRVAIDSGTIRGDQVLQTYTDLISGAESRLDEAFDLFPQSKVIVIADTYGGFYQAGSADGSRPGAFYAAVNDAGEPAYAMPTLAYHETVPGHHLQIALAAETDLPAFRNTVFFNAYTEGWALYAERLAWELGWYENDSYGNLGRLQAESFRAARLVVDTGIHDMGWSFNQAQDFFTENTGFESGDSLDPQGQIARYVVWPGQSTSYYIGFLKILELRQLAQDTLGDKFDLKEFHHVVLGSGSMPLKILERVVNDYIQNKLKGSSSLTPDESRSLSSLQKVGSYPIYTLHIYNSPPVNKTAGTNQNIKSIPPAIAGGMLSRAASNTWGCSLFAALGEPGQSLYGRNFDWDYSPILLLYNHPAQGYDSVSMVDLSYLVSEDEAQKLLDLLLEQRAALLEAPYLPFDGMNEYGLAIGMAAVSDQPMPNDPTKATLDSLQVMRAVLDGAKTVDEATAILGGYNIDWGSGPALHYLIADRSGKAVLVEFYQGEMKLIYNTSAWHLATNFIYSQVSGALEGNCPRYDILSRELSAAGGQLDSTNAMQLLDSVSQSNTQWSIIYGMDSGKIFLSAGRDYSQVLQFSIGD